jgi:hypothetical protein
MTTLKPVILMDIDGTVANLSHRLHYIKDGKNDWASFNANILGDTPIEQTIFLNNLITSGYLPPEDRQTVIFASGRSENERADTETQLKNFGLNYDKLYMRPAGDTRADYIIKREILDQIRADGYEPFIVIDDRQTVVDMWRENGLFVLQCDPNGAECRSDIYKFHKDITYPLTILVGPSGAGKSSSLEGTGLDQMVISSDNLRDLFTGDFRDQSENDRVFRAMHEMASQRLKLGLPVILDATHIRRKDRLDALKIVPDDIPVAYMVFNRSLEEKRKTAGWRSSVIIGGKSLVDKHDEVFKSNLKDILRGDDMKNVTVIDRRS